MGLEPTGCLTAWVFGHLSSRFSILSETLGEAFVGELLHVTSYEVRRALLAQSQKPGPAGRKEGGKETKKEKKKKNQMARSLLVFCGIVPCGPLG